MFCKNNFLIFLFFAAGWSYSQTCTIAACDTLSDTAYYAVNKVKVDGALDEKQWTLNKTITHLNPDVNSNSTEINNKVSFGSLWDSTYLYIGVKVIDYSLVHKKYIPPFGNYPPYLDDGIEIFLDPLYERCRFLCGSYYQFTLAYNDTLLYKSKSIKGKILIAQKTLDSGYTMEFAIPWAGLYTDFFGRQSKFPQIGDLIAFDMANNDADTKGSTRDYQSIWNNFCNNDNYKSSKNYGRMILGGETKSDLLEKQFSFSGSITGCNPGDYTYTCKPPKGMTATWEIVGGTIIKDSVNKKIVNWPSKGIFAIKIKTNSTSCGKGNNIEQLITIGGPTLNITGSPLVCPGVKEVSYQTKQNDPTYTYNWQINGGTITSNINQKSINVVWGMANDNAKLFVVATNNLGCIGDTAKYEIKINKTLKPDKPKGNAIICSNAFKNQIYTTSYTNGSIYTWNFANASINSGQSTSTTSVNWNKSGKIWVVETSVTEIENCIGYSDTLFVKLIDSLPQQTAIINYVTTSIDNDKTIEISCTNNSNKIKIIFLNNNEGKVIDTLKSMTNIFSINNLPTDKNIYNFSLGWTDSCKQKYNSLSQNSILLIKGDFNFNNELILKWNSYKNWDNGVKGYQILAKNDNFDWYEVGFTSDIQFKFVFDTKGLNYAFRVVAIKNSDETVKSYSNIVYQSFEVEPIISNVITPNSDQKNDYLYISNISAFSVKDLTVYNRWGANVFNSKSYNNDWDAKNLPDGIYYYQFTYGTNDNKKSAKGYIEVLR
ncbi:MAG: sugar-binding protein [Bacteroidota bacterium]|nr:sugar-binding protein [Bacteroidota bacterium]